MVVGTVFRKFVCVFLAEDFSEFVVFFGDGLEVRILGFFWGHDLRYT
jgi:hypothetical protein